MFPQLQNKIQTHIINLIAFLTLFGFEMLDYLACATQTRGDLTLQPQLLIEKNDV